MPKHLNRMPYYVYIIQCEGDSLYTGYTKNLVSRIKLHEKGKGARYTRLHPPKRLLHVETFDSRAEAMKREKRIKKLTHTQKVRLANRGIKLNSKKREK